MSGFASLSTAPLAVSSRTNRGFKKPGRRRAAAPLSVELFLVSGADFAFDSARSVVPAPVAAPAPVVALPAPAPAPVVETAVESPVAPLRVPAGAASVRVASAALPFRVEVVDLDDDSVSSVLVLAPSARAARLESSDDSALAVAVWAVLPGGAESLVWGEAA